MALISALITAIQVLLMGISVAGCIAGGSQPEDVEFVLFFLGVHIIGWLICRFLGVPMELCQVLLVVLGFYIYGTITDGDFALLFADDAVSDAVLDSVMNAWTKEEYIGNTIALIVWFLSWGGAIPGEIRRKGGLQTE